jgi:hypothetical protein
MYDQYICQAQKYLRNYTWYEYRNPKHGPGFDSASYRNKYQ